MKISKNTIIFIAVLSISISLCSILSALIIHLSDGSFQPESELTQSDFQSSAEDFIVTLTPPSDFHTSNSETSRLDPDTSEITSTEVLTDVSVGGSTDTDHTSLPETTEDVTILPETTVEETPEETTEEVTMEITEEPVETIPETTAHTHAYSAWKVKNKPTCEKDGMNYRVCECGDTEYMSVSASGHKSETLHSVAATCLSTGLSEGSVCTVCNKVLKKQSVIPTADCRYKEAFCIYCGRVDETALSLTAPYAGLYKADGLECLYSLSENVKTPPASLTKMITACVAIKYMSLDHVITVGTEQDLVPKGSSLCYIYKGNKIELYDLLTGMLLCSGNDAAYAVAVNVARFAAKDQSMSDEAAISYFCGLMNDYAKDIGAKNTCFKTPDGFDCDGQYSTVNDLAIITAHAMNNKTISKIVSTHYIKIVFESGQLAKWTNTNELINPESPYYTEGVTGFKTGGTENAGKCLSATFVIDGVEYIAIVMGCESNDARYENILELINIFR